MIRTFSSALAIAGLGLAGTAHAAGGDLGQLEQQPVSLTAIAMFLVFVVVTLGITYWAARRTRSAAYFYTAGGGITGFQNGLAIAGDYMSAAAFLGVSAMAFTRGVDAVYYTVGWLIGWPLILFMIAEKLRNLGKYTFSDVACFRLEQTATRSMAATGALSVVIFYLIAQMVGAGQLIKVLFGLDYTYAVILVGVLMVLYVTFGGMLATTWVQIIKAVLLLTGCTVLVFLGFFHFGFSLEQLISNAVTNHPRHEVILSPTLEITDTVTAISLSLALVCGPAGLPHILMRFFTVPDAKAARKSVFFATGFIGYFFILAVLIGLMAITLVGTNPEYMTGALFPLAGGTPVGGGNMPAIHLAHAVGGDVFKGFISAVAFATILAVVAGLTLAGASAVSHDLYSRVFMQGKATERNETMVARITTLALGAIAILLGLAFEHINVAFMVSLAFGLAASVNFPVLILAIYWKGLTTRGAVIGGFLGLVSSVTFVVLGQTVWVNIFGFAEPIFPYVHSALFSMSIAFAGIWLFSVTDKSARAGIDQSGFLYQSIRSETGFGAATASKH